MLPCTLAIATFVQYVWLKRIWALSESKLCHVLTVVMVLVSLLSWGVGVAWLTLGLKQDIWTMKITPWLIYTPLACLVVNDIISTSFLCATLQRSKLGVRSTDEFISLLIVLALNTGLLTTICSIVSIVLLLFNTLQQWYVSVYIVLSRLYVNSLLAMLNYGVTPRSHRGHRRQGSLQLTTSPNDLALELTTVPFDISVQLPTQCIRLDGTISASNVDT